MLRPGDGADAIVRQSLTRTVVDAIPYSADTDCRADHIDKPIAEQERG